MGLLDGPEAGWNSFVNNEWKSYTDFIKGGWEDATKPIWERESTPEEVKDFFNENPAGQTIKKFEKIIPIAAVALGGIFVLSAINAIR